ncbi:MAG: IS110 family transposase [Maribacter sp.]|nr:IS110 family transposase [Maribacter sp.]
MAYVKKVLKEVAGVDVAQKELVVSLGRMYEDLDIGIVSYKVFANSGKGMAMLVKWVESYSRDADKVRYVMEATGVYHERLAHYLDGRGLDLSIVLPNKISNYFKTLDIKTVNDKTASQAIARFGLERKLDSWVRPKDLYKELKQLTRERDQIVEERAMVKNRLHAEKSEALPNPRSLGRLEERIKFLNGQEAEIKKDIVKLIDTQPEVKDTIKKISTIPGVGHLTAVTVLAETNGFELIRNKKQLTSYAGFDVKEKLSGTSVKGKPRISKRGNKHLRKAMHLPSLSSVKYNQHHRALYTRIVSKNGIKMKALIAVQRKMLELIYVVFKNGSVYQVDYQEKRAHCIKAENALLQTSL